MTKQNLIAIGQFFDWDTSAMAAEYNLHLIETPAGLATLSADVLSDTRAICFKGHDTLTREIMATLPSLGIVSNYGVGYDSIDVVSASSRGIRVTNTPNVLNDDVADLAVGMLLGQCRQLISGSDHVRSGAWSKADLPLNRKMSGGRVGIVGLGRIGREIADRLAAFKTEMHYHARGPKTVPDGWTFHADPVAMAASVDFLVVSLVGGPETAGYVTREMLEALGPNGILVNVSRGSTVDELALLDLLETGGIQAAALDVFQNEPNIDPRFLALNNVFLQPHQASGTVETRKAMGQLQRDNVAAYFSGAPLLTPVN